MMNTILQKFATMMQKIVAIVSKNAAMMKKSTVGVLSLKAKWWTRLHKSLRPWCQYLRPYPRQSVVLSRPTSLYRQLLSRSWKHASPKYQKIASGATNAMWSEVWSLGLVFFSNHWWRIMKHDKPKPWEDASIYHWKMNKLDPCWNEDGRMLEVNIYHWKMDKLDPCLIIAWDVILVKVWDRNFLG